MKRLYAKVREARDRNAGSLAPHSTTVAIFAGPGAHPSVVITDPRYLAEATVLWNSHFLPDVQ